MKLLFSKIFIGLLFFLSIETSTAQNVGIGTDTPDSSALLDINSTNKGFLLPRVELISTTNPLPINKPATGLLVYNTATNGTVPDNVSPGHYYWDGTKWFPVVNKGKNFADMQYWDGTKWILIPIGNNGDKLTVCHGIPQWGVCKDSIVLRPQNNPNEVYIHSLTPNSSTSGVNQLTIAAWTSGGIYYWRTFLKFDISSLPPNVIIEDARLSLFAVPNPAQGNGVDAHYGSSNACYIQRVTSNWATNTITWNNQPTTTTVNQVAIPQSTSSFENNIGLNVTDLMKDILLNNNYGFCIRLQSENIYNVRQYASSFNPSENIRPILIIKYKYL